MDQVNLSSFVGGSSLSQFKAGQSFMLLLIESPGGNVLTTCVAIPDTATDGSGSEATFARTLPGGVKLEGFTFHVPAEFGRPGRGEDFQG